MAKTNYPEELTALVEEYLTDGIITTKERQVLLKKAQSLGVDADEFDLYIDAQQQKVEQQVDAAASKKRGKTCPFCGTPIPQLTDKCPECGQFITPEASDELQEILNKLEDALVDFKSGKDINRSKASVERYVRKANMYYGNNPKVKILLEEIKVESEQAEAKAIELNKEKAKKERRLEKREEREARNEKIVGFVSDHKWGCGCLIAILIYAIFQIISTYIVMNSNIFPQ